METGKHTTAIILAGGKGTRMGSAIPKQYIEIDGEPLLYYTIKSFEESGIDDIVLVVGDTQLVSKDCSTVSEREYCESLIARHGFLKVRAIAFGGAQRYDSVVNGLMAANEGTDVILVHDGARPCVTPSLINRCIDDVKAYGTSVAAVPARDTVKVVGADGFVEDTPDRDKLWQIQTPQGFIYSELCKAYDGMREAMGGALGGGMGAAGKLKITDDAMVMEQFGTRRVHITHGEYTNIKATTAEDLEILKIFLKKLLTK